MLYAARVTDDDVSDEGTPLPHNPALREVVPAHPGDRTALIDLEAVEAKRAARRVQEREAAGAVDDDPELTPPPEGVEERDPDVTGTLARGSTKRKKAAAGARLVRDEQSRPEPTDGGEATNREEPRADPRSRTDMKSRVDVTREATRARDGTQQLRRRKRRPLSATAAASIVVIAIVLLIVAVFVAVRATAVLTVTTVPHGALVNLDGEPVGTSPLQKRVRTGSHVIELALDGYEPFRDVFDVPSTGLPFLQPMKALPPPPPPPPSPAEIAMDLAGQAKRLFESGDLDGAVSKVDEIEKLVVAHKDSEGIRKLIKEAAAKRAVERRKDAASATREAQLQRSRQLTEEGRQLYDQGKLGPSRTALYEALKLDSKNPDPHRTLAKIFNRENEVDKVRYHLERFLALGGNDADFKVREWLKSHPK